MFSSRRSDLLRRWRPAGWSLRTRLLVALVAVVAGVCAIIGVATTVAVYHFEVGRLDDQLTAAARLGPGGPHPPDDDHGEHGQPEQSQRPGLIQTRPDLSLGVFTSGGIWQPLTDAQAAVLHALPPDHRPYTRDIPNLGTYRLIADDAGHFTGLPTSDVEATRNALVVLEIGIGLAASLLAGLIGAYTIRSNLRPLRRVAATAGRVAELPLDRGEVALWVRVPDVDTDPRTEVGQVGAALNRMLGHVGNALAARQASEMRIRHFVADASHELRTPLAAIRGYAELTRRVRDGVPPEVVHAMSRVESEAARMTVLVEDLLLLARLDSARPLAAEPAHLSRLVIDAVSDAHVAGPDHRWRLDLPAESVQVTGDAVRLHQVVANLLANARTHTPPGTTVLTSLAVSGRGAVLTVEDDGPGIPAELLPQVFDRFARGDTSRSRAARSTGLGLAIVAAVVEAHGGTVDVASRPGRTAVTVRLPCTT